MGGEAAHSFAAYCNPGKASVLGLKAVTEVVVTAGNTCGSAVKGPEVRRVFAGV